jgi:putative tricarboxylic transport membrane protein
MLSRRVLISSLAAVALVGLHGPGLAQSYPARPITLIVPFAAGGFNDVIVRIVTAPMSKTLGVSIIVENDAGAGGTTATARAAAAAADGYTLLAGSMGTHGAAPTQYPNLKYDPTKDFTPIGLTAEAPAVLVTRKDFPANTLAEFIEYVRKNPTTVNEAHAGVGSQMHTYCTLLQSILGTKTARIAYRGGAPAINDLVAGQVDFGCVSINTAVSQIQGGTVKALAIASPERAEIIRDVPTSGEAGLPEFQVSGWNAIFAPRNLPRDIQAKLSDALTRALEDAATAKRLEEIGCFIPKRADRTPEALQGRVEHDVARWASVLKRE